MHDIFPAQVVMQVADNTGGGASVIAGDDFLRQGLALLAVKLQSAAKQGGAVVTGYLTGLIDDTSDTVSMAERAAAFYIYETAQRTGLYEGIVQLASPVLADMQAVNSGATASLADISTPLEEITRLVNYYHGQVNDRLGNHNLRAADTTQFTAFEAVRRYAGAVQSITATVADWRVEQGNRISAINEHLKQAEAHERMLTAAANTLRPEYQGQPRPLGQYTIDSLEAGIGEQVVLIMEAVAARGQSTMQAMQYLLGHIDSGHVLPKFQALRVFRDHYQAILLGDGVIENAAATAEAKARQYAVAGETRYTKLDDAAVVANQYAFQTDRIQDMQQAGRHAVASAQAVLQASGDAIQDALKAVA